MANVTVSSISNGDSLDASVVSNNFTTIVNEFNGNIDNTNIKSGAGILSSKLADGNALTPVGGIIMYWSSGGSAPTNWVYCDGSVISNGSSTLNGKTTPNIMGSKFVRGVANSNLQTTPSNGGADTHTSKWMSSGSNKGDWTTFQSNGSSTTQITTGTSVTSVGGVANISQDGVGGTNTSYYTESASNVPLYIGMTYIMRIV